MSMLQFAALPILRRLGEEALDFCLPRRCLFCGRALERDAPLCPACQDALPVTGERAARKGVHFDRCLSPLYYTGGLRDSFHRYKFRGRWHYSDVYAQWMWECLKKAEPDYHRFNLVTWTPLSLPRTLKRGYDQSRRLAQGVAKGSALALVPTLEKTRNNRPQSGTAGPEERRKNTIGVYRLKPGVSVQGKRILLVDDIITTGATLEEASRILREAGAAELCCLTLARTPHHSP
jgi:ComF family protein